MNSAVKERVYSYLLGCLFGTALGFFICTAITVKKIRETRDAAIAQEAVCQRFTEEAVAGWEKCAQQYKSARGSDGQHLSR